MSSDFVVVGTIQLSGSRKSLKILIDDPDRVYEDVYYVGINDIQTVLKQPSKAAQIVKLRHPKDLEKWKGI